MNLIRDNAIKLVAAVFLLVAGGSLLVACGGGSDTSAGVGGTGIVSGKVTGFGSIYVNGGKYETDDSQFDIDGNTYVGQQGQDKLALGMVVRLSVDVENGVFGDTARKVAYDNEIEGPVTGVMTDPTNPMIKTGTIFGKTITFDQANTLFENTSFAAIGDEGVLGDADLIEVSGFRVSSNEIAATYVRFYKDLEVGSEVELRGTIEEYLPGLPDFKIDGITIATDSDTEIEVPGGQLVNGLYVEVEGVYQDTTSILAKEIELEEEDFGDEVDDVSLQGIVSGFSVIANDFFLGSQRVNASTAKLSPLSLTLVNGLNIKVEGQIIAGVLIADQVEKD